ncbi:proteoglycan 4-like isoform X1 [Branchiostoma floridae]|uniref:Proteoglycan 4-like isoform X1 n=1 Tax=Branchiostoma floridae TaxID=7739 RepID=A0A9J7LT76_BRAFL|nr:proteoglycan 4-like isoform X1 [Branchiostoma floridae]
MLIPLMASMAGPSTVISPLPATALTLPTPPSQSPSPSSQTTPSAPPRAVIVPSETYSSNSPPQATVVPAIKQASLTPKTVTTIKPIPLNPKHNASSTSSPKSQSCRTPSPKPQIPSTTNPKPQTPSTPDSKPQIPNTSSPKTQTPSPTDQSPGIPSPKTQISSKPSLKPQVSSPAPQAPGSVSEVTDVPCREPSSPSATDRPVSEAPFAPAQISSVTPRESFPTSNTVRLVPTIPPQASHSTAPLQATVIHVATLTPTQPRNSTSKSPQASKSPIETSIVLKNVTSQQASKSMAQIGSSPPDSSDSRSDDKQTRQLVGQCKITNDTTTSMRIRIPYNIWVTVILINTIVVLGSSTAFTAVMVMIGNSALPAFRGSTNGIAQSMTVLVRLLGPLVFGNLFAWSSDNGLPWPLSYHLSFNMVGLLSLLAAFLCTRLPDSINCKREEDSLPSQHIQDGDQGFYEDGAEDYYAQQALH